jgi:hypothetical protein
MAGPIRLGRCLWSVAGHSSIAITLDLYSHVTPGIAREAADAVAAKIFH